MKEGAHKTSRRNWLRASALAIGAGALSEKQAQGAQTDGDTNPGIFNVLAYGAKGDGVADDTDAIQRAINDAGNFSKGRASKGGVVFLPAGVYNVSKTLFVSQAVKIAGQGQATIDGATHLVPSSLGFDVIKIVGVNWGVVLEGFHIKAYNYTGTGGHFLRIQACQRVCVRDVHLINCWNGALIDSSGDVTLHDLNISGADVPGDGRFGVKCTAASEGNPNATQIMNCTISQWGQNVRTMDGFVLANGYNSMALINCGALNCNRAFWTTRDGGKTPNFFVISGVGCSDHCNHAIVLDDGAFTQISGMCITSSYVDNITVGENVSGPVAFAQCVITTSGGHGYRIASTRSPSVSITGGSIHDISGNGVEIAGDAAAILTGLSIKKTRKDGIRVLPDFTGTLCLAGVCQEGSRHGIFDEGSSGTIVGSGKFRGTKADVDVSRNKGESTCLQSPGSVPWPFDPAPEAPVSGQGVRNGTGTNCMVYLTGGKIKSVLLNGNNLRAQNSVYLPVNQTIEVRYSGELSWVWQRMA